MPTSPGVRKHPLIVRVDATLADTLNRNKIETGVPVAEFIRRAIRMALFADAHNQAGRPEVRGTQVMCSREKESL